MLSVACIMRTPPWIAASTAVAVALTSVSASISPESFRVLDLCLVRDVSGHRQRVLTPFTDAGGDCFACLCVDVGDDHRGAAFGEDFGGGLADAGSRSGDDGDFAVQGGHDCSIRWCGHSRASALRARWPGCGRTLAARVLRFASRAAVRRRKWGWCSPARP
jgi:hypothetical protein